MDQPTAPPGKISKYKTICSSGNLRRGGGGWWNSREGKEKGHEIPPNRREGCCLRSAWLCRAGDGEVNPLHPRPAGLRGWVYSIAVIEGGTHLGTEITGGRWDCRSAA